MRRHLMELRHPNVMQQSKKKNCWRVGFDSLKNDQIKFQGINFNQSMSKMYIYMGS
jgi:hypothetical protein